MTETYMTAYLPQSNASVNTLEPERQIITQTMDFRRSRERFASVTSNLEKLVDQAYNMESRNTKEYAK